MTFTLSLSETNDLLSPAKGIEPTSLNGNEKGVSVVTARHQGVLGGCTLHDAHTLGIGSFAQRDNNSHHVCAEVPAEHPKLISDENLGQLYQRGRRSERWKQEVACKDAGR